METLLDKVYEYSLVATSVTAGVLALCFYFMRPPVAEANKVYDRARVLLATGYLCFALGIGLFIFVPLRRISPCVADAWNLSYYFAVMFLFGIPFITLLSPSFMQRSRMKRYIVIFILYESLLWICVGVFPAATLAWLLPIFALWFLVLTFDLTYIFLSTYRKMRRQLEMHYADATVTFIRWLNTSAWLVIMFGFTFGFVMLFSRLLIAILLIVGIFVFVYIFISFQNYALHLVPVQYASENPVEHSESRDADEFIRTKVDVWIKDNGFCNKALTLSLLAGIVGTNRTYLSSYINRSFDKSFSQWVNDMRLERACVLLESELDMCIGDIVDACGFSSLSYFGRLFKSAFGMTPVQYRESKLRASR